MPKKIIPANGTAKGIPRSNRKVAKKNYSMNDESFSESISSDIMESPNANPQKRPAADQVPVEDNDFGAEMSKLLQGFSSDISKTLQSKRKRVQQYTEESIRSTSKKVLEVCKAQSVERRSLWEEFRKQIGCLLEQEEGALEKVKEAEDKVQKIVQQQQKQLNALTTQSSQRMQIMKEVADTFFKGMDELELRHVEQYAKVHNDMRKEMGHLQKKLLLDTQQQEMMNVRKQLQNMLQ